MASLLRPFRLLPPLQSTLPQCLGLRPCVSQLRLLHSSSVLFARKPSSAVVKSSTSKAPPRKKHIQDAIKEKKAKASSDETVPVIAQSSEVSKLPATAPPTIQPKHLQYRSPTIPTKDYRPGGPDGIQSLLEKLASAESPTLLYEATKTRSYVIWCITATMFLAYIAQSQIILALTASNSDMKFAASVILITGLMWGALACFTVAGPSNIIKRIYAVPSPTGRPVLRVEPAKVVFGKYPKPFEVRIGNAYTDRNFADKIARFDALRPVRRHPGVLDGFFNAIGNVWSANIKMFSRSTSFAQLRTTGPDTNIWRVDLRDCVAHEGGKTLDQLVLPDVRTPSLLTRMFRRD